MVLIFMGCICKDADGILKEEVYKKVYQRYCLMKCLLFGYNLLLTISIVMQIVINVLIIKHLLEKEPCQQQDILLTLLCMSI